eukprot:maker-scaffold_49-snap-gene-1.96-mRNA-1 protein AED:0.00 eAED:0.00 QI:163/1/1/1/1/1/2/777/97
MNISTLSLKKGDIETLAKLSSIGVILIILLQKYLIKSSKLNKETAQGFIAAYLRLTLSYFIIIYVFQEQDVPISLSNTLSLFLCWIFGQVVPQELFQ